jgi:glyoxylase-like metal-dependent hydrolase (beta-lactamase superfamily II)
MLTPEDILPLHLADVTFPPPHPLAGTQGPVYAYAIRHPDGVLLVDTGIGWGDAEIDDAYRPERRQLSEALGAHGLTPRDVALVVNTHLHFDHCGSNHLFPRVPIYVQQDEYAAAHTLPHFTILDWVDFPDAHYEQVGGEHQILPGVRLLPTPGHTPGHQSVTIDTVSGLAVLAGQAIYSAAEYRQLVSTGRLAGGSGDPERALASARRLVSLEPRHVYFSHDSARWDRPAA